MNIELRRKAFAIFGLRGSGKSTLMDHLAGLFPAATLLYDTLGEAPNDAAYHVYHPKARNSAAELETVIAAIKDGRRFQLFLIDECNRFAPSKPAPLPEELADLNDQCRHYDLSVGYIARRPVQLNQDLTELSDYIFIFHLAGHSDIRYLDDMAAGLGQAVLGLKDFEFVVVLRDRSFYVSSPIQPSAKWLDAAQRHLKGHPGGA